MKQITFCIILLILLLPSCSDETTFIIEGTSPAINKGSVRLLQMGESFFDSKTCLIKDNKFRFEGLLKSPENFQIIYEKNGPEGNFIPFDFFVDPGSKISIILYPDSITKSQIKSGKSDKEYRQIASMNEKYRLKQELLKQEYERSTSDTIAQSIILQQNDSIMAESQKWKIDYIKLNPNSLISIYLLYELHLALPEKVVSDCFKLLNINLSESKYYEAIQTYLNVTPGNHFTDFILPDSSRNLRVFSDLSKNKVTLIDFWASWCSPCREQNRKLVQIYKQYKDKGFEIVGVSIDRDTSLFIKTIVDDKMVWVNLLDRIDQKAASKIYRSTVIPSNLLIDRKGTIVAKDVPIDKLLLKIDSLVKL
jgi:thiol-disulfide isomerase/thioredoxin